MERNKNMKSQKKAMTRRSSYLSIITLNANELNSSDKRENS
jgi:hypothetical protein